MKCSPITYLLRNSLKFKRRKKPIYLFQQSPEDEDAIKKRNLSGTVPLVTGVCFQMQCSMDINREAQSSPYCNKLAP